MFLPQKILHTTDKIVSMSNFIFRTTNDNTSTYHFKRRVKSTTPCPSQYLTYILVYIHAPNGYHFHSMAQNTGVVPFPHTVLSFAPQVILLLCSIDTHIYFR